MSIESEKSNHSDGGCLPSRELAALIIDALLRAGVLQRQDVNKALAIATEEIDARKALGDY